MSIIETVAVFAGIPVAVILAVLGVVYAGGSRSGSRRYRPGRPFDFVPVWFLAAPERLGAGPAGPPNGKAVTGADRRALSEREPAGESGADRAAVADRQDATGGASDHW